MSTITADCPACNETYYGQPAQFKNARCVVCGGSLTPRATPPETQKRAAPTATVTKAQRAALGRLLKLVAPQVSRLAFNANLADRYNAQSAECLAASKERKQLLADQETIKTLLESNPK